MEGIPTRYDERLIVGYDKSDDASVYVVSEELALVQTVDFFPPIVDDPFLFGQIAAANALSDVYAMGGEPKLAMNVMCINSQMGKDAVRAILQGGYDKAYEAGVLITGGHTIEDKEPKYGLSVTGFVHPQKLLRNSSAREGDVLILTKPLGVGILMTAAQGDMVEEGLLRKLHGQMAQLNKAARDIMVRYDVGGCTDVTAFWATLLKWPGEAALRCTSWREAFPITVKPARWPTWALFQLARTATGTIRTGRSSSGATSAGL